MFGQLLNHTNCFEAIIGVDFLIHYELVMNYKLQLAIYPQSYQTTNTNTPGRESQEDSNEPKAVLPLVSKSM